MHDLSWILLSIDLFMHEHLLRVDITIGFMMLKIILYDATKGYRKFMDFSWIYDTQIGVFIKMLVGWFE